MTLIIKPKQALEKIELKEKFSMMTVDSISAKNCQLNIPQDIGFHDVVPYQEVKAIIDEVSYFYIIY